MSFKSFFAVTALTLSALTFSTITHSAQEIHDQTTLTTIINSSLTVVKFSAPWCGPCNQLAPIFERISNDPAFLNKVKFLKVDTDKCKQIASTYGVQSLPTMIFFKDGKEVGRIHGMQRGQRAAEQDILNAIKSNFKI